VQQKNRTFSEAHVSCMIVVDASIIFTTEFREIIPPLEHILTHRTPGPVGSVGFRNRTRTDKVISLLLLPPSP
jgi:hypothetical protein